jgi:hypothetical protein
VDSEDDGDTVPPVLSGAAANAEGVEFTGAQFSFTSSEAGTVYFLVLGESVPAPDAKTVRAQGAAESKGSGSVQAGENAFVAAGLTLGEHYTAYIAAEDAAGNLSVVLSVNGIVPSVRSLIGSEWYFGNAAKLVFEGAVIKIFGWEYPYTYSAGVGHIDGDVSVGSHPHEGIAVGDFINSLGDFTLDGFTVTFSNYRNSTFPLTFTRVRVPPADDPMLGTAWHWPQPHQNRVIEFLPNGKAIQYGITGYYPHPHIYTYGNWDDAAQRGRIKTAERVCHFSGATTALGWFEIKENFLTAEGTRPAWDLYFSNYKEYGHRADYVKRPE